MEKLKTYFIYSLSDPTTNDIKYIGCSTNTQSRYRQHIYGAKNEKTDKDVWIKTLIDIGLKPVLNILETINTNNRIEALNLEADYIRKNNENALNIQNNSKKDVVTVYLNVELMRKIKVYCQYSKETFSGLIEKQLNKFYEDNKEEIDSKNNMYEDLIKKLK